MGSIDSEDKGVLRRRFEESLKRTPTNDNKGKGQHLAGWWRMPRKK
jgi:hypothetical protein